MLNRRPWLLLPLADAPPQVAEPSEAPATQVGWRQWAVQRLERVTGFSRSQLALGLQVGLCSVLPPVPRGGVGHFSFHHFTDLIAADGCLLCGSDVFGGRPGC